MNSFPYGIHGLIVQHIHLRPHCAQRYLCGRAQRHHVGKQRILQNSLCAGRIRVQQGQFRMQQGEANPQIRRQVSCCVDTAQQGAGFCDQAGVDLQAHGIHSQGFCGRRRAAPGAVEQVLNGSELRARHDLLHRRRRCFRCRTCARQHCQRQQAKQQNSWS